MNLQNLIVAGGGWKSPSTPWKRLFAGLALTSTLIACISVSLLITDYSSDNRVHWLWVMPMLPAPVFLLLAIRSAKAEAAESKGRKPPPHHLRNLY